MTSAKATPNAVPVRSRVSTLMRRIEEDINLGTLATGTWLKQADLEKSYQCARIDLREALDRLSEKSLVRLESNRGYRVVEIDERQLSEILRVRAILEMAAATEIIDKFDERSLRELKRLAKYFEHVVQHGTVVEQEQANRSFHASMLHFCANSELVDLIFELRNRAPLSTNRRKNTTARLTQAAKEHFDMIACLRQHDLPRLQAILRHHVLGEILKSDAEE